MNATPVSPAPTVADIRAAATRLQGEAVMTPLLESPQVNARLGGRLLVKAETLQRTGSFKFRGAYNALVQIPAAARPRGVVAFSSGNHAQGVAAAAQRLGIPAVIVMPADAPTIKRANTEAYGAEIVTFDRHREDREAIAGRIAAARGSTIVPPFDHPQIIAGQGTIGIEVALQAAEVGARINAFVAPCSGGGLVTGCALALSETSPGTAVYAAEPEACDDLRRSLSAGERIRNDPAARSICDALLAPTPGVLPFALARRFLAGSLAVSDDAVANAMQVAFAEFKLVVEPGGAAALAAVLAGSIDICGRTIVVVASGGNVDPSLYAEVLARA